MASLWTPQANAALGSLVVAVGAWLAWDALSGPGALVVMLAAAVFLLWRARTINLVWAWSTLLLGVECFAWPILTMMNIQSASGQPSDEEMGTILSAVLTGLFSAVFWLAFSYGLFRRAQRDGTATIESPFIPQSQPTASNRPLKKP
jgi:hypothetical protein